MLLKVVCQGFAHGLLHGAGHFAVAELGLCLTLELRFCHLDGYYCGESFTEVFARNLHFRLLDVLRDGGVGICVCLQGACQCHAESGEVGSAFYGVDVIDV